MQETKYFAECRTIEDVKQALQGRQEMEKNAYLERMKDVEIAYAEAWAARKKQRDAMVAGNDWDGVKAFDDREKNEFPCPFTAGQYRALREYDRNLQNGADAFEVRDIPWDCELAGFVDTLRKAGIIAIVVTDKGTGLMDGIYGLAALGCTLAGLKTVTRADDHRFGSRQPERRDGIEFELQNA